MAVAARQVELPASAIAPDLAHLQALRGEWAGLWSRSPELGPFSAPAWTLPWAQTHAPERTFAVGLRRGGGLAALVPAFTWRGAAYLAGAGPSDYGEAMVGADDAEGIVAELCEAAAQRGAALVRLPQLRPGNPLLQARGPAGWRSEVVQGEVCPTAPIRGEDGLGAMEPAWRKKLEYARRRLAREVSHLYRLAAGETLQADLAILESLHARRWAERGEPGVLSDALTRAFLRAAAPELLADGLLRLHVLEIAGAPAAALLALHAHAGLYVWITAFDPAHARRSPGSLLWARAIETAAAEGAREIHFLRGREPYKRHWGAADRPTFERVLRRG